MGRARDPLRARRSCASSENPRREIAARAPRIARDHDDRSALAPAIEGSCDVDSNALSEALIAIRAAISPIRSNTPHQPQKSVIDAEARIDLP